MKNLDTVYAEKIAEDYAPKSTSKVIALKKLDRKAKRPSQIFAFTFGIAGSLILGVGMCLAMKVIGAGTLAAMILGSAIGIVGIAMVSVNYLLYKKLLEKGKKKYAFEIMELAREITEAQH